MRQCTTILSLVFFIILMLLTNFIHAADSYEDDNTLEDANSIVINDQEQQQRSIHIEADEDWVKFYGLAGESYAFRVTVDDPPTSEMYAKIELFDADGQLLDYHFSVGLSQPKEKETLMWTCSENGKYYVKISNYAPFYGQHCNYRLRAFDPSLADFPAFAACTGAITRRGFPLLDAVVIAVQAALEPFKGAGLTSGDGGYGLEIPGGTYDLEVLAGKCKQTISGVELTENATSNISVDFGAAPGDLDGNGAVELEDELIILQLLSGMTPQGSINLSNSLEDDCEGSVGLDEAVFVLRKLAEL